MLSNACCSPGARVLLGQVPKQLIHLMLTHKIKRKAKWGPAPVHVWHIKRNTMGPSAPGMVAEDGDKAWGWKEKV